VGLVDWDLRPPCLQYRDATTGRDRYEELMLKSMRLIRGRLKITVAEVHHQVSKITKTRVAEKRGLFPFGFFEIILGP
jgi:hypothetical protein